jgi:hypothetical protein
MARKKSTTVTDDNRPLIHFSARGLILFVASVIIGTVAVIYVTFYLGLQSGIVARARTDWLGTAGQTASSEDKPWGELVSEEIVLEYPDANGATPQARSVPRPKALITHLQIRPDSDVDKLLGYWVGPASGVRYKDLRPLLESIKRKPDGGGLSVLYLLPPFARERLNTFPVLLPGVVHKSDCQWGTFNFFNDLPDDRFYDIAYLNKYLQDNFYQVASPTEYGDIILILDAHNNILHSGVQIADDVVFTKTGTAYQEPWALMHLKDLLALYAATPGVHLSIWRNNST